MVIVVVVAVTAGYLVGGRLHRLADLRFRGSWLLLLAVAFAPLGFGGGVRPDGCRVAAQPDGHHRQRGDADTGQGAGRSRVVAEPLADAAPGRARADRLNDTAGLAGRLDRAEVAAHPRPGEPGRPAALCRCDR